MNRLIGRAGTAAGCAFLALGLLGTPAARSRSSSSGQAGSPPGQPQGQQPVFRGGANFVNVDVYPRRDGRLVEGLTAADFQIFEDGKPQKIEHFEFIKVAMNTPDASRRDSNTQRDAERLVADPHSRVFVIYLDDYNLTLLAARELRRPLREFLERVIGPVRSVCGDVSGHAVAASHLRSAAGRGGDRARSVLEAHAVR